MEIRYDEPIEKYHSGEGLSFTAFKHFIKSPAHYKAYIDGLLPDKDSESRRMGQILHLILESKLRGTDLSKKVAAVGGRWAGEVKEKVEMLRELGIQVVKPEELEAATIMSERVLKKPRVIELLSDGYPEASIYSKCDKTGLTLKCRADFLKSNGIMSDFKTVTSADQSGFMKQARVQRYGMQAAFYTKVLSLNIGREMEHFCHICVETDYPYGVNVFEFGPETIARLKQEIDMHLGYFKQCVDEDTWPDYADEVQPIEEAFWEL